MTDFLHFSVRRKRKWQRIVSKRCPHGMWEVMNKDGERYPHEMREVMEKEGREIPACDAGVMDKEVHDFSYHT